MLNPVKEEPAAPGTGLATYLHMLCTTSICFHSTRLLHLVDFVSYKILLDNWLKKTCNFHTDYCMESIVLLCQKLGNSFVFTSILKRIASIQKQRTKAWVDILMSNMNQIPGGVCQTGKLEIVREFRE